MSIFYSKGSFALCNTLESCKPSHSRNASIRRGCLVVYHGLQSRAADSAWVCDLLWPYCDIIGVPVSSRRTAHDLCDRSSIDTNSERPRYEVRALDAGLAS